MIPAFFVRLDRYGDLVPGTGESDARYKGDTAAARQQNGCGSEGQKSVHVAYLPKSWLVYSSMASVSEGRHIFVNQPGKSWHRQGGRYWKEAR